MPIAFYCRARPQACDAFDIFKQARHVFIGYPLVRIEKEYDPQALGDCLVDPCCPNEEWWNQWEKRPRLRRNDYTKNRNFIPLVTNGSISVIPRPDQGIVYLSRITGDFTIVNAPTWGEDYLQLRRAHGLDANDNDNCHVADVAQGWPVDGFHRTDLSRIPGWLRYSLLGRGTYGELWRPHPINEEITAYSVLDEILRGGLEVEMAWSLEPDIVKDRLINSINNPCAFENLIVSLLQLEFPDEVWHHTGGPGDGGIDGFGCNEAGETVGIMQAKYRDEKAPALGGLLGDHQSSRLRRYAAVFLPENPRDPEDGTCVLDLRWVVNAVCRHWRHLPLALTLRIGESM